jgi:lipopolysaccharide export system protein LptC
MAMTRYDNLHSRLVGWLKIVLPLAALAVLATLFLFARKIDPTDAIPYADVDIEERLREPRMTNASYSGVTADGSAITLTAEAAMPGADGDARATGMRAALEASDGSSARFVAAAGLLDNAAGTIALSGGVTIDTSTGYHVQTDSLQMALDRTFVEAPGAVQADGPAGTIIADRMMLNSADGKGDNYQLVFNGNVKLVYLPAP